VFKWTGGGSLWLKAYKNSSQVPECWRRQCRKQLGVCNNDALNVFKFCFVCFSL
jgi:hypothetical protein